MANNDQVLAAVQIAYERGIAAGVRGANHAERRRHVGDKLAKCAYCNEWVLYAIEPSACASPYVVCSPACTAEMPRVLHLSCFDKMERDEAFHGNIVEEKCDVCNCTITVDLRSSSVNFLHNALTSRRAKYIALALLLFLLCGYLWKLWAFIYIVRRWEPVDAINNPALVFINHTTHREQVRVPNWSEFHRYNHCVMTEYGKRVLLGPAGGTKRALTLVEQMSSFYSYITAPDAGDDENVEMRRYFAPCSHAGALWLDMAHIALCFHALRYQIVAAILIWSAHRLDKLLFDGAFTKMFRRSRVAPRLLVGGAPVQRRGPSSQAARIATMRRR